MRSFAFVLSLSLIILLACVASEQKVDTPPPVRVGTTATLPPNDSDLDQLPNTHPTITDEEFERRFAETFEQASRPAAVSTTTVRDAGQPLRRAPVHVVRFDNPALPAPILDERRRSVIAIPIVASPRTKRMNLALLPNVRDVARRHWSDPVWRELIRASDGMFPVALWRARGGVATFWKYVWIPVGPGLPSGTPQFRLDPDFFRGGDVLLIEATEDGPLLIAYMGDDPHSRVIVWPLLSVIEATSNDPNAPHGAWMMIGGAR